MNSLDDFENGRSLMIEHQLKARGITSSRVLDAMSRVAREQFIGAQHQDQAYADGALPIECEQTISQPYIVALMTQSLQLTGNEHVLEIGTGSGYQTAVLAELAKSVVTIERHEKLFTVACERLQAMGFENVKCLLGDGHRGSPNDAPFDRIMITAATSQCPPALLDQLADDGILVGPFGPAESQTLQVIRKSNNKLETMQLTLCRFVPLVSD